MKKASQTFLKADISVACSLSLAELVEFDYGEFAKVTTWMKKMKDLPEWQEVDEEYQKAADVFRQSCCESNKTKDWEFKNQTHLKSI